MAVSGSRARSHTGSMARWAILSLEPDGDTPALGPNRAIQGSRAIYRLYLALEPGGAILSSSRQIGYTELYSQMGGLYLDLVPRWRLYRALELNSVIPGLEPYGGIPGFRDRYGYTGIWRRCAITGL